MDLSTQQKMGVAAAVWAATRLDVEVRGPGGERHVPWIYRDSFVRKGKTWQLHMTPNRVVRGAALGYFLFLGLRHLNSV
jgi:hypothetical protein